jgi:hypothetical protein
LEVHLHQAAAAWKMCQADGGTFQARVAGMLGCAEGCCINNLRKMVWDTPHPKLGEQVPDCLIAQLYGRYRRSWLGFNLACTVDCSTPPDNWQENGLLHFGSCPDSDNARETRSSDTRQQGSGVRHGRARQCGCKLTFVHFVNIQAV